MKRPAPFRVAAIQTCPADLDVIVDPDRKILAGPAFEAESILYADIQGDQLVGPRWQLDIAGHYARPDVFELIVHRRPTPLIREAAASHGARKRSRRRSR